MTKRTFYISTPIYYPSDNLHIGHAYTTVAADAISRWHRQIGDETWFLTGTDEHGQKIERKARSKGKEPIEFVDEIVGNIKKLWELLKISYNDFIRTTEPRHITRVQEIFRRLHEKGDIYKGEYEGWYCADCEAYYTETQVKEFPGGKCPDHDKPIERLREEAYFFKLSRYADQLLDHIEKNPDFIQPASRRNEMIAFIKSGLEDLCVSRTSFKWGIPVPFDDQHVIYVWIDALSNYATALGWPDGELYRKFWPCNVHLVGKEIVRFHTVIWPITLLALGEPLPKQVFGHGWLVLESGKMSKTRGNVVDPKVLVEKYGLDAVRYFLLREVPFGADGVYSEEALILRTNVDLANDLGNLLSRATAMIQRFAGGVVPEPSPADDDGELRTLVAEVVGEVEGYMERLELSNALTSIWKLVDKANKYIEETSPWALARDEAKKGRLASVLYNLAETLRLTAVLLVPYLVETPEKIWAQLGLPGDVRALDYGQAKKWGGTPSGTRQQRGEALFPRIEAAAGDVPGGKVAVEGATSVTGAAVKKAIAKTTPTGENGLISIDDFAKVDLRVAEVISAEKVQGADKLLRLQVKVGDEVRQIVSGIAKHYTPESLLGKRIVVVANLKPAKLWGIESAGMLLAASNEEGLTLVTTDAPIATGTRVK